MGDNQSAANGLFGKIYDIMSSADNVNSNPIARTASASGKKPFVSFCAPGFPLDNVDFGDLTTKDQVNRCSFFSQFVNSVPAATGTWSVTAKKAWDVYDLALTEVRLPKASLSSDEEKILKKAEAFLREEVDVSDPFTGEKRKEVRATIPNQMYDRLYAAYAAAVRRMNNARISAITNPTPNNVADWTNNGPLYEKDVINAYSQWGTLGYRDYVTRANGIIANLTGRGSFALYDRLRAQFSGAEKKDMFNSSFWPTFAYPPNIISPQFDNAWTKFSFSSKEVSQFESRESTSWGGGVSASFGLWSVGASGSYAETKTYSRSNTSGFDLTVDLIQVPILRPWMSAWIFSSRGWKGTGPLKADGSVASGDYPLAGFMPMLPTTMIVARKLRVNVNMESVENRSFHSETNTSASIGWGPFSLRGNYSKTVDNSSHDYKSDASGVSCDGAQIIGFICDIFPKSPNPDPSLDWPADRSSIASLFNSQSDVDQFGLDLAFGSWLSRGR